MKFKIWLLLLIYFPVLSLASEHTTYSLAGMVKDKANSQALEYAAVYIEELGIGTVTDRNGKYHIEGLPAGNYRMRVQYLGYATVELPLSVVGNTGRDVSMDRFTLQLGEVNILGETRAGTGSAVKIKREALEYIQPSSLNDIFQLLPGGLLSDGKLNEANQVKSRQAGNDRNTAFGMAIIMDGAPLSNNGGLSGFSGTDAEVSARSVLNGGVDLRLISTDHLEEAEVIQGIPSAKYGDLSSGVVILKSKKGYSPWQFRVKADPLAKLGYIGKGFKFPGKGGTLNVGADILQARPDVRERLEKYTRISSQVMYANRTSLAGRNLIYDLSAKYYGNIESEKNDPDLMAAMEDYSASYNRFNLAVNGGWELNASWLSRLDLTFSADYTADILKRKLTVTPIGIVPLPVASVEGESEGVYLPAEYLSDYRVENRPLNLYFQLSAKSILQTGQVIHSFLYGYEARYDKNVGKGPVYDITKPPYPGSSFSSRPRAFHSVPAMVKHVLYAEDNLRYAWNGHRFDLKAGVRLTKLGNLPHHYKLKGKLMAEPRLNVAYTLPSFTLAGVSSTLTLRGGYGEQVKLPSLDYLYPDPAWFDVPAADYYSQIPENRFLWVVTRMKERVNPELTGNRNRKIEAGMDWKTGGVNVGVTGFYERSDDGFTYGTNFLQFSYLKYEMKGEQPSGKPSLADFTTVNDVLQKKYTVPLNAKKLIKKGLEYQIDLPRINPVRTRISLNGAYYHTTYDNSLPQVHQPSGYVNGKPYPYVGLYDSDKDGSFMEQFNTTGRFDTHIPEFRLHFTTFIQAVWFTSTQNKYYSGIPTAYIGLDGEIRPFTDVERNHPDFKPLITTATDNYFKKSRKPVSIALNLKATKEIGDNLKISFFVNRLWDYNPVYKNNLQQEVRKWETPAFGAELTLKL